MASRKGPSWGLPCLHGVSKSLPITPSPKGCHSPLDGVTPLRTTNVRTWGRAGETSGAEDSRAPLQPRVSHEAAPARHAGPPPMRLLAAPVSAPDGLVRAPRTPRSETQLKRARVKTRSLLLC